MSLQHSSAQLSEFSNNNNQGLSKASEKAARLEKLGLKTASKRIVELEKKQKKLMIAYEFYRFVREEKMEAFRVKLIQDSMQRNGQYKNLSLTAAESYDQVPPDNVLASLETALERKCFDRFEVAHVVDVKDPILFGKIDGCSDYFFIDQWDDDVKIEDILKPNEG